MVYIQTNKNIRLTPYSFDDAIWPNCCTYLYRNENVFCVDKMLFHEHLTWNYYIGQAIWFKKRNKTHPSSKFKLQTTLFRLCTSKLPLQMHEKSAPDVSHRTYICNIAVLFSKYWKIITSMKIWWMIRHFTLLMN